MHPALHIIPAVICITLAACFAAMLTSDLSNDALRGRSAGAMKVIAIILIASAGAVISTLEVFL